MKTIEEAAKDYSKSKSSAEVFRCAHETDFKAGVEFVAYPESFVPKYDFPKTDVTLEWENLRLFGKRTS